MGFNCGYRLRYRNPYSNTSQKSQLENYDIPNDVLVYIANNIESNIRELEGALNRVIAYASLTGSPITLELAQECLKQILANISVANINHNTIIKVVSRYYDISRIK